jgi:hypothetical protein
MTVRTAYDAVAGTALTATNLDKYPGGWIGYAQATSNQGSITTAVDLTGLTVTVTVGTSRYLKITGYLSSWSSTNANAYAQLLVMESSTTLQSATGSTVTIGSGTMLCAVAVLTPSSGSHTYKLQLGSVTAGTLTMSASATAPAYILVEDMGSTT